MRHLLIAAVAVMLLAGQAHAQGRNRPDTSAGTETKGEDPRKRMAREEAAAKAAMQNIPDSKEKYDPWKIGK